MVFTALKILLKQHVGVPCKPIVESGDVVKRGQLIAIPNGLGTNIHSSFSATIGEVTPEYIELIEYDLNEDDSNFVKLDGKLSKLELIQNAGIVGAGGAGFPTFEKFKFQFEDKDNGKIIINAAECEPILHHNISFIEDNVEVLISGLKDLMEITNAKKGYFATKHKYTKAFLTIRKAIEEEKDIELFDLTDMYPAGDERVIIREITGIELQPGELPWKTKCIVTNVETVKNVYRAINELRPVITKDITIGGRLKDVDASDGKVYLDVPIGLPAEEILKGVFGPMDPSGPLYVGGPFTGQIRKMDSPVTKTSGGFLVATPLFEFKEEKFGLIGCECGAQLDELRELAQLMGGEVVAEKNCKRMEPDPNGRLRCNLPGICPGQAPTVLALKKQGATAILIGTCESRTNTVAKVTPNMGLKLIHKTDFVLRAASHRLFRRIED
ncbi:proline reductase-associated electron transfer protein PrdC [Spiroplasma chinense]|uniref:Proline reductase-associated electron transfer protein PrdC n=1 Tax=Spiroplasma chinense TaxID=216932 RepID=A0A5B9Y572_9MOLU|nr:proline reductase-associated electron transfer protein PrdC [Spiroplasma chinense]QEH61397.1 proline reductase-associated electron transfer protein PrdC [Spiroplasma chinense]